MQEIWKDIVDYENLYQVSNLGRVRSLDRIIVDSRNVRKFKGVDLKKHKKKSGYLTVQLKHKDFQIHRLVAKAFIPNPDGKPQVNHKDGDKQNNRVDNLEWCTCEENINHAYKSGLKNGKKVVCVETNDCFNSIKAASLKYKTDASCITKCCKNKINYKTAGGYHWEYI